MQIDLDARLGICGQYQYKHKLNNMSVLNCVENICDFQVVT
jgi:hypothetical protein